MNKKLPQDVLRALQELPPLACDMRFGQLLATLGELGEDMTDRTLWDIEDSQLVEVIERFKQDLARRMANVA